MNGSSVALAPTLVASIAVTAAVCAVWLGSGRPVRRVALSLPGPAQGRSGRRLSLVEDDRARTLVCAASCAVLGILVLGLVGSVAGAGIGVAVSRWVGRLERPSAVRARERLARDLPLAVDLMAVCVQAGLPLPVVLPQVARAVGGPLRQRLDRVQARWELGADPVQEWRRVAADPSLRPLGLALVRAHRSGAPLADTLSRVAADTRRERRTQVLAAARSVGVATAGPLAVCFLPAFLLVGVVPTVVGGFTHLL